jgi:hypothetical protein
MGAARHRASLKREQLHQQQLHHQTVQLPTIGNTETAENGPLMSAEEEYNGYGISSRKNSASITITTVGRGGGSNIPMGSRKRKQPREKPATMEQAHHQQQQV